jgi:hypothetical protein
MSDLNPFYAVTVVVFAACVLLALLQSRGRDGHSPSQLRMVQRRVINRVHRLAHMRARRPMDR